MAAIAREHGARDVRAARDEAEALALAAARRNAFSALARGKPTTILEDVTVPRSELATMVAFIAETAKAHQLEIGTFGHMGDGNLHPTFLTDERNADEMQRVHHALDAIVGPGRSRSAARSRASTASAWRRRQWLRQQMGEGSYALMTAGQARARPGRTAEPREDLRLTDVPHPPDHRLLGAPAVHALRHVPADVSDLRHDQAGAQQPARPHRADAGDRRRRRWTSRASSPRR